MIGRWQRVRLSHQLRKREFRKELNLISHPDLQKQNLLGMAYRHHLKIGFLWRMRRKALLEGYLERRLRPGSPLFCKRQEVVKWYIKKQLEIYLMKNIEIILINGLIIYIHG